MKADGARLVVLSLAVANLHCSGEVNVAPPGEDALSGAVLAAGTSHTCAIFGGGAVRCWGDNSVGQLGRSPIGDPLDAYSVDLGQRRRATAVFSGTNHSCAILDGGDAKCWGANQSGQLGLEDITNRGDGLTAMGDGLPTIDLGAGQRAVALAPGSGATCALLATGRVKCWGDAYGGALGYGDNATRGSMPGTMGDALPAVDLGSRDGVPMKARAIAALEYHSFCAILDDADPDTSALKCWGSNDYCELGTGTTEGDLAGSAATTGDGLPWVDLGVTTTGQKRRAIALAGGFQFVCVLGDDGAVLCWGDNLSGQLGLGFTSTPRSCLPTEIGDAARVPLPAAAVAIGARGASYGAGAHACALLETGDLTCWGENTFGQLGTGDTVALSSPSSPLVFADPFSPAKLVLGDQHTCAISTDQRIKCWGSNQDGQLGPSAPSSLDEPGADTVLQGLPVEALAAGSDHTCAVLTGGALKCWGRNLEGQLGVGDRTNRGDQPAQMGSALPAIDLGGIAATGVAAGASHTCALLASGDVKCWGDNSSGQLGTGDATALLTPRSAPIALGASAFAVAAGAAFTCALLGKGAVACWGDNANGQLGTGDTVSRLAPAGAIAGFVSPAIAIAAGDAHVCVLLGYGQIACWGANGSGQLGTGDLADRTRPTLVNLGKATATAVSAAGRETCAMLQTGDVKCWGENGSGQLGDGGMANVLVPPTSPVDLGVGRTASTVSVGGAFVCAILDTAGAKCWGDNLSAELGTSFTAPSVGSEPGQLGDALPTVVVGGGRSIERVAAGRAHACAVLDTHDVHCWGDNTFGQLGVGDAAAHSFYFNPTVTIDLGGS